MRARVLRTDVLTVFAFRILACKLVTMKFPVLIELVLIVEAVKILV